MKKYQKESMHDDYTTKLRCRGGLRKRLISMINRADDRQVMKLYEYAHRMMRDSLD